MHLFKVVSFWKNSVVTMEFFVCPTSMEFFFAGVGIIDIAGVEIIDLLNIVSSNAWG